MKVTVTKYLNVRVGSPSINAPCYQYLAPGSELEVDGQLYKGDMYDGVNTWFKDAAGNYYWSNGVNENQSKQTFKWFNDLNISGIWTKYNERGARAKIAILDTGYKFSNRDIADKITTSKILIDAINYPGIELKMDDQSNDAHGTRCASLIGAQNTKDWVIGIAPECEIIIGKISIDKEILDFNYILNGIKWAISQNVDIISISYAYEDLKEDEITKINNEISQLTLKKNILIFAACGNSGVPQRRAELYPASFDWCVSVGSSTSLNHISKLTILSEKTIIHAIGEDIESYNEENIPTPDSGTSFSTPIVAGIAALAISYLKGKNNSWNKKDLVNKIYNSGIEIKNTNKKVIDPVNLFNNL